MNLLRVVVGWTTLAGVALLFVVVIYLMITGRINLATLISEPGGGASMSRFQFLVFTFVIAFSFLLVVISQQQPTLPDIPASIFGLLGISASSYLVSKGIQQSSGVTGKTDTSALEKKVAEHENQLATQQAQLKAQGSQISAQGNTLVTQGTALNAQGTRLSDQAAKLDEHERLLGQKADAADVQKSLDDRQKQINDQLDTTIRVATENLRQSIGSTPGVGAGGGAGAGGGD